MAYCLETGFNFGSNTISSVLAVCIFQLTRAGQDLLMCVCMNCDQLHSQSDAEVTNILTKIRLKTKLLVNHYLLSMRLPDVRFLFMQFSCTFSLHVALWLMSLLI